MKAPIALTLMMALLGAVAANAAPYLYDMGSPDSAVWEGFTRVTPASAWSPAAGFGWRSPEGMRAVVRRHAEPVENRSRGTQEPPPIWTNPITEDAILGDRENTFLIETPAGDYQLYIVCGSGESFRAQYFDFDALS
jgi:hypothetical protein